MSFIRLSFWFGNENRMASHPVIIWTKMITERPVHSVVNFFQMTTGWKCHPVVIKDICGMKFFY